jgi:hypothetical protein
MTRCGAAYLLLPLLAACASAPPPAAIHPAALPDEPAARKLALGQIGRQLYVALAEGQPERLMLDELELRSVLDGEAATRVAALRARGSAPGLAAAELRTAYSGASYQGVCFDRARLEPAGSRLGLLAAGFVFDRALVVGLQPGGSRVAAWVEGTFVSTGDLVFALILSRVEAPRREHADLDLLQCDLRDGLDPPRPVVVETPASY